MTESTFGSFVIIRGAWGAGKSGFQAPSDQNAAQPGFPVCSLTFLTFLLCKMGEALAKGGFSIAIFATQHDIALRNDASARGL